MGLQIYTPSNADQWAFQGANALGQGIGRGIQSLGDDIQNYLKEKKRKGDLAAQLRRTLKVAYPDRAGDFESMGLPDLQGELEGQALKSYQARQQAQDRLNSLHAELFGQQVEAAKRAAENDKHLPEFMDKWSNLITPHLEAPPSGEEGPSNLIPGMSGAEAIGRAAKESGYVPNLRGAIDDMIRKRIDAGSEDGTFTEDPVTGERFFQRGNNTLKSGINPAKKSANPQVPQEIQIGGKPSGWALFPDGHYRRTGQNKSPIDVAAFDTDGDGVISVEEWKNAMLSHSTGGIFPGQTVPGRSNQAKPAAPQPDSRHWWEKLFGMRGNPTQTPSGETSTEARAPGADAGGIKMTVKQGFGIKREPINPEVRTNDPNAATQPLSGDPNVMVLPNGRKLLRVNGGWVPLN